MRKTVRIRRHELGLWFRHDELHQVFEPGKHIVWSLRSKTNEFEVINTLSPRFEHEELKALVREKRIASRLSVVDLKDTERALVWIDGRLGAILASGVHAFWNQNAEVVVERFDVSAGRFEHPKLETVENFPGGVRFFTGVRVESHERVMLFKDGKLVDQLGAGRYAFWRGGPTFTWKSVDLREQVEDIQGQEIMTADKVTLRVNLVVTHRVTDAVKAVTEVVDWSQALYREAQLELRAAIGGVRLRSCLPTRMRSEAKLRTGSPSASPSSGFRFRVLVCETSSCPAT